jgi:hypothetical protein
MLIKNDTQSLGRNILFNLLSELGYTDIKDFQSKNGLDSDGLFGMNSYNKLYKILLNIKEIPFEDFYFKQLFPKKQIIWHHSAGWDNARGMFDWWKADKVIHVATAIGISDDGTVSRGFDESYWAASIGCKSNVFTDNGVPLIYKNGTIYNNRSLDEQAVAVEVCNWGSLTVKDSKYYSWSNAEINKDKVIELNYKNTKYFEAYTDAEIKALKYWTLLVAMRFDIPLVYNYDDFFKVSKKALSGEKGLFTHNSYRVDKNDVSPQPKLIEMAKTLESYTK